MEVNLTINGEVVPAEIRFNANKRTKFTLYMMGCPLVCQSKKVQELFRNLAGGESDDADAGVAPEIEKLSENFDVTVAVHSENETEIIEIKKEPTAFEKFVSGLFE